MTPPGSRTGTITHHDGSATITFERRLAHPIERVWAAITDPAQRAQWFGTTTLEAREGGRIDMVAEGPPVAPEMRRMTGRIRLWRPPHVFEHEWSQSLIGDTVVRYELSEDGEGTLLRFTHSGFKPPHAKGYIPGEHAFLDRLEAHLDQAPLPGWGQRYGEVHPRYA